jgi:hypothetical protein
LRLTAEPAHACGVGDNELEFVLTYADYVDECRIAGVEPLTFDALRELVIRLNDSPTVH